MANTLSFEQVATLLNATLQQVRGDTAIADINTANFATVAQTALLSGYDPLLNAISQVLTRTYFSVRPYSPKFSGIMANEQKWGNIVRKVQVVDKAPVDNKEYGLQDGAGPDQYELSKPKVLQLNYYGAQTYSRDLPIFKNQLDVAFSNAAEMAAFWQMLYQNLDDMIAQDMESLARLAVCNFIGGKIKANNGVIHLVTKYNEITGESLTAETVRNQANWVPFCRWMLGYIKTLSEKLTERSTLYHVNITDKPITRHTPLNKQKVYLLSDDANMIDTTVMSQAYHDNYLKVVDFERVGFWQSIQTPEKVKVTPSYLATDGTVKEGEAVDQAVFGIIFDEEAISTTLVNKWSAVTPLHARAGYAVNWTHYTGRWCNDFTENGLILLLD